VTSAPRRLAAVLALPLALLAACANAPSDTSAGTTTTTSVAPSESGSASTSESPTASATPTVKAATSPVVQTPLGVSATGVFGDKPAITVPATTAPTDLKVNVLSPGTGTVVAKGEYVVVNYLGRIWKPKAGKTPVFDNSYDRHAPIGFTAGSGGMIKGWEQGLMGQKVGSRVLLSIPPSLGYGTTGNSELSGQTLVFVVDLVDAVAKDASATGTVISSLPAGFPQVVSVSGQKPSFGSVAGVKVGAKPVSTLLIKGNGPAVIDSSKQLLLQFLQADEKGKVSTSTWDSGPQTVPASQVLASLDALKGQPVGSRAMMVAPGQNGSTSGVLLIVDVLSQY